jgi:hypothetical protein
MSKWREITAYLSGVDTNTRDTMAASDPRMETIRRAVQIADSFLAPYANSPDHETRLHNLEEVMKRVARYGFLLFSQPSTFKFDYSESIGGGVVVFPGLVQVADETGSMLRPARMFVEKKVSPV